MPQKGVDHLFPHWKKDLEQCIPATSGFCKKSALCLMMNHSGLCKCCLNFSRQGWADWHGHPDCLKNGSITKAKWWKEWNMYMCLCLWFLISYHSLMKKKKKRVTPYRYRCKNNHVCAWMHSWHQRWSHVHKVYCIWKGEIAAGKRAPTI